MAHACDLCNRIFDYPSILKLHYRSHISKKPFRCEFCPKRFTYEAYLVVHNQTHLQIEELDEGLGNGTLLQKSAMKEQKEIHASEREKDTYVMGGFPDKNGLDNENVSLLQNRLHTRVTCNEEFWKECDLNLQNQIHIRKVIYTCENYNDTFVQKSTLDEHRKLHISERKEIFPIEDDLDLQNITPKQNKSHNCVTCNEEFLKECDLERHLLSHKEEKPVNKNCDESLSKKSKLSIPYSNRKKQRSFICDTYGKAFSWKGDLKKHSRIHSNVRPFKCDSCGKAFKQKGDLNQHYRIHSNEKPFICTVCDKAFSRKNDLNRHYRIHSN